MASHLERGLVLEVLFPLVFVVGSYLLCLVLLLVQGVLLDDLPDLSPLSLRHEVPVLVPPDQAADLGSLAFAS